MRKYATIASFIITLLFVFPQFSKAQCVLTIVSSDSVCSGQSLRLIARVTGGNPTSYSWTSNPAGNYPANDTIFVNPTVNTTYTATVSGNFCARTASKSIIVKPQPPTPGFTFGPDSVCSGTPMNFSASPTGAGLTFEWDFGDGTTGSGANTTHRFDSYGNGTGSFTVTVTARSSNGCTSSFSRTVKVIQRPKATLTPALGTDTLTFAGFSTFYKCITNQQSSSVFSFRNSSTPNSSGLNYTVLWGDTGVPFTTSSPWTTVNHTYGLGIYILTLIVSDPATGCTDTATYRVFFGSNPAGGIASLGSTTICGPATLAFILTNYQSNPPGTRYTVSFNDSTGALTFNHPPPDTIFHLFDRSSCGTSSSNGVNNFPNSFAAFLVVTNPCGITSGSVLPIYVSTPPQADFIVSNNYIACTNSIATISNTSINGQVGSNGNCSSTSQLLWNITPPTNWTVTGGVLGNDNGQIGSNYDPTGWTSGTNSLNVRFSVAGTYQIRLIAANSCGRPDTIVKSICVTEPPAPSFTLPDDSGCAPFLVIPNNTTPTAGICGPITYIWSPVFISSVCARDSLNNFDFINGTNNQSPTPNIRFNNQGRYSLRLTAQNICGSFTTPTQDITVKYRPRVTVSVPPGICSGDTFFVSTNASLCASTISGYNWTFSNATPPTSTVQNPGGIQITTPGRNPISLSVTSDCGVVTVDTAIVVDTVPQINPGVDTSVCGGQTIQIGAPPVPGYIYNWQPSTGLNSSTIAAPTATITNNTDSIIQRTYSLIAGVPGCVDTASVTLSVYPRAVVNTGGPYTICSGGSVQLNGSVSGGASSALWTSAGGSFNPVDSLNTLFTPNVTSGSVSVTLTSDDPLGPCPAVSVNTSVTISPLPLVTNNPLTQTVCSGVLSQPVPLISSIPGSTFTWTATSPDGITGFIDSGTSNTIPAQIFTNPSNTSGIVIYTITPRIGTCTGPPVDYVFTVLPVPDVQLPASQTICSGASFNSISFSSTTNGTTFSWTSSADSFINGNQPSGNGSIPGHVLNNTGTDTGTAIFTVIPTANGCSGIPVDYRVIVQPIPGVLFTPAPQIICSGQTTTPVILSSNTPNVTFSWTAQIPNGISNDSSGTSIIPAQTLTNTTNQPLTITYTAQTTTSGAALCPGLPATYTITVIPIPEIDFNLSVNSGCTPLIVNFEPVVRNLGVPDSLIFVWDDGTPNTILYPNQTPPIWNIARHIFYNNTNQPDTFFVALVARNQCIDTSVIKPVILAPNLVNAFFTATPTSGCEPLTVTLQDLSTGAVGLSWCFGFDLNTNQCTGGSAVNTPGSTFQRTFSGGTHTIALYATNGFGCARDTAFQTINVSPAPVADFISTTGLCANLPIAFTDRSVPPAGSFVSSYRWTFGDGDSAFAQNPSHVFTAGGIYSVCLEVTSTFGCFDSVCKTVNILTKPSADFNVTDTCLNTPPITFTNNTTGANFYAWDFGDGNTSALTNPSHVYSSSGAYQVRLVGSTSTCSDTAIRTVNVYPVPDASFTLPTDYRCGAPASFAPINTTGGANNFFWSFGNNITSSLVQPVITYTDTGSYLITLAASNSFGCSDTARSLVYVYPNPVIQSVTILPSSGCRPLNVSFTANTQNANVYVWDFGDGATYTGNTPTASHTYNDTGSYSVLLKVYSFRDCGDTLLMTDTIHVFIIPVADFIYDANDNVEPYNGTVVFTNRSLNAATYVWDFGDGTNSSETNPSHLFPTVGEFDVMLVATSSNGCSDTATKRIEVIKKSLYVPNILAPDFSAGNNLVRLWKPSGSGLKEYRAQIFNTWGELLWESTSIDANYAPAEGWDGTYQGKTCQQDVYVWKIEAVFLDGTRWLGMAHEKGAPRKTIGSVTLVR